MLPFRSYYGFGTCSRSEGLGSMEINGESSGMSSRSTAEAKAIAACKSHSEAERRRRERINGHLATLRSLLPNTTKTDKASLLAEVVQHVKDLKRHAADVGAINISEEERCVLPGETDELRLELDADPSTSLIKASLCCEDRPGLLSDLTRALRSLRLRAVKAEMATLGGRTRSVFLIQGEGGEEEVVDFTSLQRALKAVLDKSAAASASLMPGTKRPRLSRQFPNHALR